MYSITLVVLLKLFQVIGMFFPLLNYDLLIIKLTW